MNKNGFTLVELITCILIIALLGIVGMVSYNSVMNKSYETYYQTLEQNILLSGNEYFNDHRSEKPINTYSMVSIENLISKNYIEQVKDKNGNNCSSGNVYIYPNDNGSYEYEVCLECGEYKSNGKYCTGNIPGEINILSKLKSTNKDYNSLLSYNNVEWVNNDDVKLTLMHTEDVYKYIIIDNSENSQSECLTKNNQCEKDITKSGSYTIIAMNSDGEKVSQDKTVNIKIDRDYPTFDVDYSYLNIIKGEDSSKNIPIVIKNIKDDSGIKSIEYQFEDKKEILGNDKDYTFSFDLKEGTYNLKVIVTDLSDKQVTKNVEFMVIREDAPLICYISVDKPDTYETSKKVRINVSKEVSNIQYKFNSSDDWSNNDTLSINKDTKVDAYIKYNGQTISCGNEKTVDLNQRTEYTHKNKQSSTCYTCTGEGLLCGSTCYYGYLNAYNDYQSGGCISTGHNWNTCNSKCYNDILSANKNTCYTFSGNDNNWTTVDCSSRSDCENASHRIVYKLNEIK